MIAPRWATALIRRFALPGRAEDAIGDLNEMHGRRVDSGGRAFAMVMTTFGALDMAFALIRQRVIGSAAAPTGGTSPEGGSNGSEPGGSGRLGRTLDEALRDISLAGRT
ncbi:MAG: hypothetical protein MJB57_06130, partial [Gemmatimonadetes bacterium]|nr:hypothetical protein [Gemmatimonadota bacterium]